MVKRIQKFINNYPKKIFDFKTANEIFNKKIALKNYFKSIFSI